MPSSPSEEAKGAYASYLEKDRVISNPFELPGVRRQRQTVCVPGKRNEEKTPGGGGERTDETGATGAEDKWRLQRPVAIEESSGCRKPTESAHKRVTTLAAAQEAFHEDSSHASGEAWPNQWEEERELTKQERREQKTNGGYSDWWRLRNPADEGSQRKVPTREYQLWQRHGRRSMKIPATLQEKRGQTSKDKRMRDIGKQREKKTKKAHQTTEIEEREKSKTENREETER
ncbi:hypothetical protein NDU88_001898 [Pleurodeles waltl]|uniref:Uncharacterized protein n=1 Tax=Pleurodeles waltl TaxID=8319 RepID=A0AAV7KRF7_PLEWA|nr:hypothetical protein NDU88_001898 [Pleurodeles waltl]